jgi:purine-binding chemotaxis protein CheW
MTIDRHLCFNLGAEEFGIPLHSVKEVLAVPEITSVPFAPSHFVGIMNLRGQVLSLIDMRSKFGIKGQLNNETAVIICNLENTSVGIVVDSINSVITPQSEDLSPKPQISGSTNDSYINAIYKNQGRLVLLLDINKTLGLSSMSSQKRVS